MKKDFNRFAFKSTFLFSLLIWSYSHLSAQTTILPGAFQQEYLLQLKGKKVGVVAHQASLLPSALYEGIDSRNLSTYTSNMLLQERVGEEWGALYGRGFTYDDNGSMLFRASSGGNYYYSRTPNKYLGNLLPDFTGGVTSNMSYKNFDLSLGFDFQKGGKYYSRTERYLDHSGLSDYTAGLNDKGNPLRDPVSAGGGVHI